MLLTLLIHGLYESYELLKTIDQLDSLSSIEIARLHYPNIILIVFGIQSQLTVLEPESIILLFAYHYFSIQFSKLFELLLYPHKVFFLVSECLCKLSEFILDELRVEIEYEGLRDQVKYVLFD